MQAAAGTGRHQAEVVADLGELDGQALQGGRIAHVRTGIRRGFHQVRGFLKAVAGEFAHPFGAQFGKAGNGVQARADGGAAHIDFLQEHGIAVQVGDFLLQVVGKGVEFLAGGHRNGVLQLRAAHLDDVLELHALGAEGVDQVLQGLLQVAVHPEEGIAEGGGIGVVGALGAVHVVIGRAILVFAFFVAHQLQGAVGDDLVGVHIHRSAGAALHHIHRELVPQLAGHNLLAGRHDGVADLLGHHAQFRVGGGRSHLYIGHRDDVLRIVVHMRGGNLVVVDGALGLYAVIGIGRNLEFADQVALDPEFLF